MREGRREHLVLEGNRIEQTLALLQPVFDAIEVARNKSVALVLGVTGDGKSTLLNYLNGSNYEKALAEDGSGNTVLRLLAGSIPEVFSVGEDPDNAETLYPQLRDMQHQDNVITYCDLPGFFETREEPYKICAAAAPYLLSRLLDAEEGIKGIVWVLNATHFDVMRAQAIKETLKQLLRISNNNANQVVSSLSIDDANRVASSLTIVINRHKPGARKDYFLKRLDLLASNSFFDGDEKILLNEICKVLEKNNQKIILSDVCDAGLRSELHEAVFNTRPLPRDTFNFISYNQDQDIFHAQLNILAEHYLDRVAELGGQEVVRAEIDQQIIRIEAEKGALQGEIVELTGGIQELEQQLIRNNALLAEKQAEKTQLENDNTHVEIGRIRRDAIPAQHTDAHGPERQTFGLAHGCDEHIRVAGVNHMASLQAQGWLCRWDRVQVKKSVFRIMSCPPIQVPAPGNSQFNLSYEYDHPARVNYNNANLMLVGGTEQTDQGYRVTIQYAIGAGCPALNLPVTTLRRYTNEGKEALEGFVVNIRELEETIRLLTGQKQELERQQLDKQNSLETKDQLQVRLTDEDGVILQQIVNLLENLDADHAIHGSLSQICQTLGLNHGDRPTAVFFNHFNQIQLPRENIANNQHLFWVEQPEPEVVAPGENLNQNLGFGS